MAQILPYTYNKELNGFYTEKTDGFAFAFGIDAEGFFTQTSHSPRIRKVGGYFELAKQKFGDAAVPSISAPFDHLHELLIEHKQIQQMLRYRWEDRKWDRPEFKCSGEVFYVPSGQEIRPGVLSFVATAYRRNRLGSVATFVVHRFAEANRWFPLKMEYLSNEAIHFESDAHLGRGGWLHQLDIRLNFDASMEDNELHVWDMLTFRHRRPKWGPEREGFVLHLYETGDHSDTLYPVKVINPLWKQWKEERKVTNYVR